MSALTEKSVLLFFKDFETDSFVPGDRHLKRISRPLLDRVRKGQKTSGFRMWFLRLARALRLEGYDVRINEHRTARRNPTFPVGLVGYPFLLDGWDLPNPAVLGPSMFDHPESAPHLLDDERYRWYLLTCDWMFDLFATSYPPDRLGKWFAGIDLENWPDSRHETKDFDLVIYDKIRFDRDEVVRTLLEPILSDLARRNVRHTTLRYGSHDHQALRDTARRSRSMLFLCEHETQGMAYQEAMAMNVPVLAWDPGWWKDPAREGYALHDVPTTSVPYFGPECGEIFTDVASFRTGIGTFLGQLDSYEPRQFVRTNLSFAGSARAYLRYYDELRDAR